jgi:hypothetical protein
LTTGLALVTVAGTASAVAHERAWNAKTLACLVMAIMLIFAMAGVTYYYHLHENDENGPGDEDGVSRSMLMLPRPHRSMLMLPRPHRSMSMLPRPHR